MNIEYTNKEVQNEGYLAAFQNKDYIEDNPYPLHSQNYWEWRIGYIDYLNEAY